MLSSNVPYAVDESLLAELATAPCRHLHGSAANRRPSDAADYHSGTLEFPLVENVDRRNWREVSNSLQAAVQIFCSALVNNFHYFVSVQSRCNTACRHVCKNQGTDELTPDTLPTISIFQKYQRRAYSHGLSGEFSNFSLEYPAVDEQKPTCVDSNSQFCMLSLQCYRTDSCSPHYRIISSAVFRRFLPLNVVFLKNKILLFFFEFCPAK